MTIRVTAREQVSGGRNFKGRPLTVKVVDPTIGHDQIVEPKKLFAASPEIRRLIPAANIEIRTPNGLIMDSSMITLSPKEIDAKAAQMDASFVFPRMLEVAGRTYKRIMIGELTEREAAVFLRAEDVEVGFRDERSTLLQAYLRRASDAPLTNTTDVDAKNYIAAANKVGRKFRLMTDNECDALPENVRRQIRGENWFLTGRGTGRHDAGWDGCGSSDFFGQISWRKINGNDRGDVTLDQRCGGNAIRLVED